MLQKRKPVGTAIVHSYRDFEPSANVREAVEAFLKYVPAKYLVRLRTSVAPRQCEIVAGKLQNNNYIFIRRWWCWAIGLLVAILVFQTTAHSLVHDDKIAFAIHDGRIFIPVYLNAKGPFSCILDTGAVASLNPNTAKRLWLSAELTGSTQGTGEAVVKAGVSRVKSIRIGNHILEDVDVEVVPTDDSRNVFGSVSWDCTIGLPVFERWLVQIDYDLHQITISDPSDFSASSSGYVVNFSRPLQIPVVVANLDGIEARLGVDTGARSSLLLYSPFVRANNLEEKYNTRVEAITGWGIGGPIRSKLARGESLRIGGISISQPLLRLSVQRTGLTTGTHLDGLIGADILRQFTLTLNYPRGQLVLQKNLEFGHPTLSDGLGAWIGQSDASSFSVLDVVPNGASAGKLIAGDRILAIDGVRVAQLVLPEARDRFRDLPDGSIVQLLVNREGKNFAIGITIRHVI